jgi:hypothetical protein
MDASESGDQGDPMWRVQDLNCARALLAALALIVSPAYAARPFVTDDARIVDPQGYQIESYYKHQREFHENEFWFLPAFNPWGRVELTLGGNWIDSTQPGDSRSLILQAKTLLVPLQTNGAGFALTLGVAQVTPDQSARVTNPYVNTIGSFSFLDDRVVLHANLGAVHDNQIHLTRGTWGVGAEVLILAPRLYGILETYGQRLEKPTVHGGLRIWIVPNRVQVDSTIGSQHATPFDRRFGTIGLRLLW